MSREEGEGGVERAIAKWCSMTACASCMGSLGVKWCAASTRISVACPSDAAKELASRVMLSLKTRPASSVESWARPPWFWSEAARRPGRWQSRRRWAGVLRPGLCRVDERSRR